MLLKTSVLCLIIVSIINTKAQNGNGRGDITLSPTSPTESPITKTPTIAITSNPCKFTDGCNYKNHTHTPSLSPIPTTSYPPNTNGRNNITIPPTAASISTSSSPYTSTIISHNDNTNVSPLPTISPSLNADNNITDGRNDNVTLMPTINSNSPTTSIPTMPAKQYDFIPTFEPTINPSLYPTKNPTITPTTSPTIIPTINPTITPTIYSIGEVIEPKSTAVIYLTGKMGAEQQNSETLAVSTVAIIIVAAIFSICIVIICSMVCIKYRSAKRNIKHKMSDVQNKMGGYNSKQNSNGIQRETESDESAINLRQKTDDNLDGDIITMVNATQGDDKIVNDEFIIEAADETRGFDNDEDIVKVVNRTKGGDVEQFILEDNDDIIQGINETDTGYDVNDIEMDELNVMITPQLDMSEEDVVEGNDLDIDNMDTIQ